MSSQTNILDSNKKNLNDGRASRPSNVVDLAKWIREEGEKNKCKKCMIWCEGDEEHSRYLHCAPLALGAIVLMILTALMYVVELYTVLCDEKVFKDEANADPAGEEYKAGAQFWIRISLSVAVLIFVFVAFTHFMVISCFWKPRKSRSFKLYSFAFPIMFASILFISAVTLAKRVTEAKHDGDIFIEWLEVGVQFTVLLISSVLLLLTPWNNSMWLSLQRVVARGGNGWERQHWMQVEERKIKNDHALAREYTV